MYKSTSDSSGSSITRTNDIYSFDINTMNNNNKDGSSTSYSMTKMTTTANRNSNNNSNQTLSSSFNNTNQLNKTIEVVRRIENFYILNI